MRREGGWVLYLLFIDCLFELITHKNVSVYFVFYLFESVHHKSLMLQFFWMLLLNVISAKLCTAVVLIDIYPFMLG